MSAATAIKAFKRFLQGLANGNNNIAPNGDEARKAFCQERTFPTAAAAATAAVAETSVGVATFDQKLRNAYFENNATLASDGSAYATVTFYKRSVAGTTTTLATWTTSAATLTDHLGAAYTAGATDTILAGETFCYTIAKASVTTAAALAAGSITAELERMG